jgi:hypothetical protein
LDQTPEQVHLADPDAAQADGFAQVQKKVQFANINPDEKQQGEEDDEAYGPGIMHGLLPKIRSLIIARASGKYFWPCHFEGARRPKNLRKNL